MAPTGETTLIPREPIGDSTPVRLGLVIILLCAAAAAGRALFRQEAFEEEQKIARAERKELDAASRTQELRIQRVEDAVQTTAKALEAIDARQRRWEERGFTRPARGGQ